MNRRLRKKLALGEFVEYGFDITGTWSPSDTDVDALIDAFDERGFLFAGTFGDKLGHSIRIGVEYNTLVGVPKKPAHHVGAHPSKTDHSELHSRNFFEVD